MHFGTTFFIILTIFADKTSKKGMKQAILSILTAALLMISCGSEQPKTVSNPAVYNDIQKLPGDSTLYGLACEGCTDSLLIYLPFTGGDPDTLNILNARVNHRVFGRPDIGDEVAVVLSADDKAIADLVINISRLKGEWCYMVSPRLRPRAGAAADSIVQLPPDFPDSLRKKWFQPREYGVELLKDNTARPIGIQQQERQKQQAPVIYPTAKRYRQWHIFNGHLLLSETRRDTLGNVSVISTDTTDIVLLRRDSLCLRFADGERGYYRKQ